MKEITPNDAVALNLAYYRQAAGLSQQELAARMGWLKQVLSTAERSWAGGRTRNFTADDLADLSAGLDVPVAAFFVPPPGTTVKPLPAFAAAAPESAVMDAYRARLAAAGLSATETADAEEVSRQAKALSEYRDQWRDELSGMLMRMLDAAQSL